jgi:hypothetical protein
VIAQGLRTRSRAFAVLVLQESMAIERGEVSVDDAVDRLTEAFFTPEPGSSCPSPCADASRVAAVRPRTGATGAAWR